MTQGNLLPSGNVLRWIVTFTLFVLLIGGVGRVLAGPEATIFNSGLGQLVWLVSPLAIAFAFRAIQHRSTHWGLQFRLRKSWGWYCLATILFPMIIVAVVGVGQLLGTLSLQLDAGLEKFLLVLAVAVPMSFLKNIVEEFTWRGFLYAGLEDANVGRLQNHLIVGIVWALWHLPFLGLFVTAYHDVPAWIYVPLFLIAVVVSSVICGEIRRRSRTVWTVVVLHTMANAATAAFIFGGVVVLERSKQWMASPGPDNIVFIAVISIVAIMLYLLPAGSPETEQV